MNHRKAWCWRAFDKNSRAGRKKGPLAPPRNNALQQVQMQSMPVQASRRANAAGLGACVGAGSHTNPGVGTGPRTRAGVRTRPCSSPGDKVGVGVSPGTGLEAREGVGAGPCTSPGAGECWHWS